MSDSMRRCFSTSPAIQWFEGMLLGPQHFQQQDIRFFQVLSHHIGLLARYHWGVHSLKLDPVVLADGLIRVQSVEAGMPDGTLINFISDIYPSFPSLDYDAKAHKETLNHKEFSIYLCIPEHSSEKSSVLGEFPRYLSIDGPKVKDN